MLRIRYERFWLVAVALVVVAFARPASCETSEGGWHARRLITFKASETEVNVLGKPGTWYGTAMREDIGKILDYLEREVDPYGTFEAHRGTVSDGVTSFVLKTPKGGRYLFAYSVGWLQLGNSIKARYKAGEGWVEFPPGRIAPDFVFSKRLKGAAREFCHWIEIPDGQTETAFEIHHEKVHGALVAERRVDPFAGMPGRKDASMFDYPDVEELMKTELGRAVLYGFCRNEDPRQPMSDAAYQKALKSLPGFEKMNQYIKNQRMCWGVAADGLRWRMSGDKKRGEIAGQKARRIAGWPTWGYPGEWTVDYRQLADPKPPDRVSRHNHALSTSIKTAAMAAAYDLAYNGMREEDRLAFRLALDHYAHLMYVQSFLRPSLLYGGGNWGGWFRACIGLSAGALYGEDRYAEDWIRRFNQALEEGVKRQIDPKGQAGETIAYLGFGLVPGMLTAQAIQRARGGEEVFKLADGRLNEFVKHIIYLISPNGQSTRDFGDTGDEMQFTSHSGLGSSIAGMLCFLSRSEKWPDVARWAAHRGVHKYGPDASYQTLSPGRSPVMNILLFKAGTEKPPSAYPEDFPLAWHPRSPVERPADYGFVVMRTGFDSADDIKFTLMAGHSRGHHGHPSQGSFVMDAYGDLLSQSAGYNLWGRNAKAYNTVTFDSQGQISDHTMGRPGNDGHIERFVHTSVADLCLANMQPAFRPNGGRAPSLVNRCLRYVLFVRKPKRRGYFVIVDDVDVGDNVEHEYHWNFHTTPNHRMEPDGRNGFVARSMAREEAIKLWTERGEEAALRGLSLAGNPGGSSYAYKWPGPSKKYPWIKEVKVDLRLAVVWPENFTHEVTYKVPRWQGADMMYYVPDWLRVTQKAREGVFFTVFYPEREDIGVKMPELERIVEKDLWGAKLKNDTIVFSQRKGLWKYEDIETDARLVFLSRDDQGKVLGFAVGEGTTLKVAGEAIFTSDKVLSGAGGAGIVTVTDDGGEWRASAAGRGMP